ncbi:MAG: alpha-E domain-containing protein [Chloroflexota bacterium]|nr:alpha-E domain-containing protein [Chloroflexota bacterium]
MLSRVADSLYWMSRYLERAEHTARLIDVHLNHTLDQSNAPEARRQRLLASLHIPAPEDGLDNDYALAQWVTFERSNANTITARIATARDNARQVREQISTEMWEQLNQLFLFISEANMEQVWADQPHEFYQAVKKGAHLFRGITDSTMNHGQGWHFIQLGCFIERTVTLARLLEVEWQALIAEDKPAAQRANHLALLCLLKSCTAFEAYSKVYTANLQVRPVAEFLLLNREFPHSIGFAIGMIQTALNAIAASTDSHKSARVYRLAGRLHATFNYGQIDEIINDDLCTHLAAVQAQCIQIHDAIYQLFITYPIEEKLAAYDRSQQ